MPEFDLFSAMNPEPKEGDPPRPRRSLGQVAKANAIVRRDRAGVGKDGLLKEAREDEVVEGMRPGEAYRPFGF